MFVFGVVSLLSLFWGCCLCSANDERDLSGAIYSTNFTLVKSILQSEPKKIQETNWDGSTPIHTAVRTRNTSAVAFLLPYKPNIDATDKFNRTPLILAAENGDGDIVRLLLDNRANPNLEDLLKGSALSYAAQRNDLEIAKLLIARGANPNGGKQFHAEPLALAAFWGNSEIVNLLIQSGADVNARGPRGGTALQSAVRTSRQNIIKQLVKHGADVNAEAYCNWQPLAWALAPQFSMPDPEIISLLRSSGANLQGSNSVVDRAMLAAYDGDIETVQRAVLTLPFLLQKPIGSLLTTTILHLGAMSSNSTVVAHLIGKGMPVDLPDDAGRTPLLYAVHAGRPEVVQYLLDHGAKVNLTQGKVLPKPSHLVGKRDVDDVVGMTALSFAKKIGQKEIAAMLEKHGASETPDPPSQRRR